MRAQHLRPRVVILDLNMPAMNGYEAAAVLKADRRKTLLVALSAMDDADARTRTGRVGFDAHLSKPGDLPTLLRLLESVQ